MVNISTLILFVLVGVVTGQDRTLFLRTHDTRPVLMSFGGTPQSHRFPLQLCQGDCDSDQDCAHGLKCFLRGRGGVSVPGCRGGAYDYSKTDYCVLDEHHYAQPPTPHPTHNPTRKPTHSPTKSPTGGPTKVPTKQPTKEPTNLPTKQPTKGPTELPTKLPTTPPPIDNATCQANPHCNALGLGGFCCPTTDGVQLDCCDKGRSATTISPTKKPSDHPTEHPTPAPTLAVTQAPASAHPTRKPTDHPTKGPTDHPTKGPTNHPTKGPTDHPTKGPTDYPTKGPTDHPTKNPSSTEHEASCSANPKCHGLGLTGLCCPNTEGLVLDCCGAARTNTMASCSSNEMCANAGLTGDCCPTLHGVHLACCGSD